MAERDLKEVAEAAAFGNLPIELLRDNLHTIAVGDADSLISAQRSYGDSWKRRGGVGAFMMLARKWDRIENQTKEYGWDIFKVIEAQGGYPDGILDDIRDLRRYLMLVEEHMVNDSAITYDEGPGPGYVNQD